jgi:outer membrane protein insertion porin family
MTRFFFLLLAAVLVCGLCATAAVKAQQPGAGQTFRLAKIEFMGLQRLKSEEAVAASGLTVGQTVGETELDQAAKTLLKSGLFKKLSYRLRSNATGATVTFTVEEAASRLPVVFDNFIWFTDEELFAALRREVPGYDGTVPLAGDAAESIKHALLGMLRQKKIAGVVDYAPTGDSARLTGMLFSYKGDALNVCSINFPGAAEVPESELQHVARFIVGKEYSRGYSLGFANESLLPLYRKRGLLKATFTGAQGKPGTGSQCNGVAVSVPVDEGAVYHLGAIEWAGNAVLESPELTHAFDMKPGDVADGLKIADGFGAVQAAYGVKGYIDAKLQPDRDFDDAQKTVAYRIGVTEGPQFLMGALTITGLTDEMLAQLKAKWRLQTSDVYDNSYLRLFMRREVASNPDVVEYLKKEGLSKIDTSEKPDRERRTVAVTITFARP